MTYSRDLLDAKVDKPVPLRVSASYNRRSRSTVRFGRKPSVIKMLSRNAGHVCQCKLGIPVKTTRFMCRSEIVNLTLIMVQSTWFAKMCYKYAVS